MGTFLMLPLSKRDEAWREAARAADAAHNDAQCCEDDLLLAVAA
jgi:hypothetical protein